MHEYPFHELPKIGLVPKISVSADEYTLHARELSDREKNLLQSCYVWMQVYDDEMPPLSAASYSELWFLVKHMKTLQCTVKVLSSTHMRHYVEAHTERYNATGQKDRYQATTGQKHDFLMLLHHDFSDLEKVLRMCVHFEADLNEVQAQDRMHSGQ